MMGIAGDCVIRCSHLVDRLIKTEKTRRNGSAPRQPADHGGKIRARRDIPQSAGTRDGSVTSKGGGLFAMDEVVDRLSP
jgi:hypothetical protein